jgi:hypothetical protein
MDIGKGYDPKHKPWKRALSLSIVRNCTPIPFIFLNLCLLLYLVNLKSVGWSTSEEDLQYGVEVAAVIGGDGDGGSGSGVADTRSAGMGLVKDVTLKNPEGAWEVGEVPLPTFLPYQLFSPFGPY